MAEDANSGDATHNNTSQGEITRKPKAVSKRKVWFCTWAAEHCGNWAQSNGLRLCQKHRRQHDEEREQRLFAASCLANISNNDQLRDEVGHAENGNASAGENFDNQAAIVYERLNDENDANINATAIQTLHNRAIDNEGLNNEIVNATVGNVNRELDNQQDSGDTRISDLDGIPSQHLTNRLTIMDERIDDLEQRVCRLQNMLHSIGNRDKRPTSNNSLIRTYQGLSNEDYAQRYAGSPLSFSERIYDEMENTQNLDKLECNDGDQKQISNKKREEVECDNGNQKQKSQKRKRRQKKVKRTTERRKGAHAGLSDSGLMCYSNAIIQCIASCSSYVTDFLGCPPNEEHERFQLYFEFTSVINSLVSGGGDVVNLKKLNTLYRGNENFKQDEGKYHYNPMDK